MSKDNLLRMLIAFVIGVATTMATLTLRNRVAPAPIIIQPAPTALPPDPTATPAPISVYINGAVAIPGVYTLPPDARVAGLIAAAGGFSAEAFTDAVNMAQPLIDGIQVYVPDSADSAEIKSQLLTNPAPSDAQTTSTGISSDGRININSASKSELEEIPAVGPSTAASIMAYREDNGPFQEIEEIMNVSGIGEGKFEQMKDAITVGEE